MSSEDARAGSKRKASEPWKPFVSEVMAIDGAEIETRYMNTPHRMAQRDWLPDWLLREGVRELLANLIDQARTVADKYFSKDTPLEFTEENGRFLVHIGRHLLAEAKYGTKSCKYVENYHNGGSNKARAVANEVKKEKTQFIELTNYSSSILWSSFHVGHTTKRDNKAMIGKHGEGLTGACVVLNRAGCNVFAECTHFKYAANVVQLSKDVCFQLKRREAKTSDLPNTVRFSITFDPSREPVNLEDLMSSVRLSIAATAAGIATSRGTLLIDKTLRGKQFNRSIFVGEDAGCLFGYDFVDPDKNLMQGRDRNVHGKEKCLVECGRILSEAILASEEVRKEVLDIFVLGANYNSNSAGMAVFKKYEDIRDGEHLSAPAIHALREHFEATQEEGKKVVFCIRETGLLSEIKRTKNMTFVFSHQVLHNFKDVIQEFETAITQDAQDIDPNTRIGGIVEQIRLLMGVTTVRQSVRVDDEMPTGFWLFRAGGHKIAYVTNAHKLGPRDAVGLTEEQEINLSRTLQFALVPVENQVKIMRLLRNEPDPEAAAASSSVPAPEVMELDVDMPQEHEPPALVEEDQPGSVTTSDDHPEPAATAMTPPLPDPVAGENAVAVPESAVDLAAAAVITECDDVDDEEMDDHVATTQLDDGDDYSEDSAISHAAAHALLNDAHTALSQWEDSTDDSDGESEHSEDGNGVEDVFFPGTASIDSFSDRAMPAKRRRLDETLETDTTSTNTSVEAVDRSFDNLSVASAAEEGDVVVPPPKLLQDPPEGVNVGAGWPSARKLRQHVESGVWLYSDDAQAGDQVEQLLSARLPGQEDRQRLLVLTKLVHVVVFVAAGATAGPAFNHNSKCICINMACCVTEEMFKFVLQAQLRTVSLI